jgi:hypothetical protein
MKIKRTISILVLVCFFTTQVVIKPKDAEAVVPLIPLAIDLAVGMLVSAGVTYASNAYLEHIARNELNKLTPDELADLSSEGKISELTVDEFLKHGYKTPKKTPKKIIKLKGGIGKTALISALISGVLTGGSYAISYITSNKVDTVEGIEENISYNTYSGYSDGYERLYSNDYFYEGQYFSITSDQAEIRFIHNDPSFNIYFRIYYGQVKIVRYTGGTYYVGDGNSIAVTRNRNSQGQSIINFYVDNVLVYTLYYNGQSIAVDNIGAYTVLGDYDLGVNTYEYTGTVNPVIESNPSTDNNKQRLINVNEKDDKYVIVIENTDGSYSLESGTEIETSTGTQYIPDLSPGEDVPIIPGDPTEGSRPDARDLYGVLTTRWPFSLPWDIAYLIGLVNAEPVPPRFSFTLPEDFGGHELEINFDHPAANKLMSIVRWFIVFGFCIGIVLTVRKLYGGST